MKKIVIIGLREGVRNLHIIDRLNEQFNIIALAEDINQVAKYLKGYEIFATDLFDFSAKDFEGQIATYLNPNITSFKYDELDEKLKSCDGVIIIGAPAKAGTLNAFGDSTLFNSIFTYKLNGKEVGMLGILKEITEFYSKNIILSLSDEGAKKEAETLGIHSIANKKASIRNRCERYTYQEVDKQLESFFSNGVKISVINRTSEPYDIEIEFTRSDFAYAFKSTHPDFDFIDARTIVCHKDKLQKADDLLLKRRDMYE